MIGLIIAAAIVAQAPGAPAMNIVQYLRIQMHTYDDKGVYVGEVDSRKLPPPAQMSVISADPSRVVAAGPDKKRYYLRPSELILEGATPDCTPYQVANRPADQHRAAGDVGAASGLSGQSVSCVK